MIKKEQSAISDCREKKRSYFAVEDMMILSIQYIFRENPVPVSSTWLQAFKLYCMYFAFPFYTVFRWKSLGCFNQVKMGFVVGIQLYPRYRTLLVTHTSVTLSGPIFCK